jgi:glycine betaine/proline transport system ATP-binding protein
VTASTINSQAILSCRHVWKVYGPEPEQYFARGAPSGNRAEQAARMRQEGHIPACVDVSFDVHKGEIFVIMGLSGSGKSTIVRCLSRLIEPSHGQIMLEGEDLLSMPPARLIDIRRHKIGMVFQSFGLLPHLNVIDNICFPLKLQGLSLTERRTRARRVIELVGLEGREENFPHQLSGGQQQRVGIARSLAVEPDLWLLDEPFSALDPLIRRQMQDEFLRIQRLLKKSIVFITHDFLEALRIADRMAIMRDGQIVQVGTPAELVVNPADDYVAEFSRDVPLVRVLTANDCLAPGAKPAGLSTKDGVPMATPLESLLPKLAAHAKGLLVTRPDGQAAGYLNSLSVVAALSRKADQSSGPDKAEAGLRR